MSSLAKDIGRLVLATACGTAIGVSAGHSIEAWNEARFEEERQKNSYVACGKYEINRRRIAGAGIIGGVLGFAIYAFRRKEDDESRGSGTNDLDDE